MADEKITWYSQASKNTISDTDTVMVYAGQKTYTVPFSAIKSALPSSGDLDVVDSVAVVVDELQVVCTGGIVAVQLVGEGDGLG